MSMPGPEELSLAVLVGRLRDEDVVVRLHAAVLLSELGDAAVEAVPGLLAALAAEDARVRRVAAWTLGYVGRGSAETLPALQRACADADADVRQTACSALQTLEAGGRWGRAA
jgi:HEAT repeat protein